MLAVAGKNFRRWCCSAPVTASETGIRACALEYATVRSKLRALFRRGLSRVGVTVVNRQHLPLCTVPNGRNAAHDRQGSTLIRRTRPRPKNRREARPRHSSVDFSRTIDSLNDTTSPAVLRLL